MPPHWSPRDPAARSLRAPLRQRRPYRPPRPALRDRADTLDKQATHVPQPISERLRDQADRLRGIADTHGRARITLKDTAP